jgi:leucyl aminopeptidase (aminopeptidase T)
VSDDPAVACRHALLHNLGLRSGERVVVIADAPMLEVGRIFETAARTITRRVDLVEIPAPVRSGEEPPGGAARAMLRGDVVLLTVSRSLSWTRAREEATRAGTRLASMPGITEPIILRALGVDYEAVRERANRLADLLDAGGQALIRSKTGTNLALDIAGRRAHGRKGGIYREPGQWGNLPCGEAFIAPVEGTARGIYVVDASHGGLGRVAEPIRVTVEGGRATVFEGGEEAVRLRELLESAGDRSAFNVAELGIGCNDAARLSGVTLEDEKVLGTCHVALGGNAMFGGAVRVGIHLDGVLRDPTISLDGEIILDSGKIVRALR